MIKKLAKGIEDSEKEKDRLVAEKEKLRSVFKEIEEKAFSVQETYRSTQKVKFSVVFISQHGLTYQFPC